MFILCISESACANRVHLLCGIGASAAPNWGIRFTTALGAAAVPIGTTSAPKFFQCSNCRIPSRKNDAVFWVGPRIDPFSDFFIRAEILMSQAVCHRSKQMVVGRSNVWRGKDKGWGKTSHFSVSKYVLTALATCGRALSCWRITLSFRNGLSVTHNDSANTSCIWHESSAINASNSESSKVFSFPPPCRSSTSKSPPSKRWNHSRHSSTESSLTVSTWEHSISLSRGLFQMKAENQNFSKISRIWLENWHRRLRINLWCKHNFTNMVLSLCWQISKLTVCPFWSANFNQHLPLQPSIEKRRKQSCELRIYIS